VNAGFDAAQRWRSAARTMNLTLRTTDDD
jgi:hypothetical protein